MCSITTHVWFMCKITLSPDLHCSFSSKNRNKAWKVQNIFTNKHNINEKNGGAPVFVFSKVFSTFVYPHQFHSESGDISWNSRSMMENLILIKKTIWFSQNIETFKFKFRLSGIGDQNILVSLRFSVNFVCNIK